MDSPPKSGTDLCPSCRRKSSRVSVEELEDFEKLGVQITLPKGAVIFQEGDTCHSIAVVRSGQVKLSCISPSGRTLILKIAMPGEALGLDEVISDSRYEASAEAIDAVVVRSIGKNEFLGFLERHCEAGIHAMPPVGVSPMVVSIGRRRRTWLV